MRALARLLAFLISQSRRDFALAVLSGLASGASSAALVAAVNSGLKGPVSAGLLVSFGGLLLLAPAARLFSQYILIRLGQDTVLDLRTRLADRVVATPLRRLEEIGPARLLVALTDDISAITQSVVSIPDIATHGGLVVGCLVYMGWLSPALLLAFLAIAVPVIIGFRLPLRLGFRGFERQREVRDDLYEHFRSILEGIKEVKLHVGRRRRVLAALRASGESFRRLSISANMTFGFAVSGAWTFFFVAVGLVVFAAPRFLATSRETLIGYALVLLFLRGPLQVLTASLPHVARGGVALGKIESLGFQLAAEEGEAEAASSRVEQALTRLELEGVSYTYRSLDGDRDFVVGPIDLVLEPGEVVFLIGGNGSGKTSLAKVLLGLYSAGAGVIRLNGQKVDSRNLDRYRQQFSAVFSDFFLFRELPLEGSSEAAATRGLERLRLGHKVEIQDGSLSTTALSQGQRRRLALLTAYLEDRPGYVFDEWAADQDPYFKEFFYRQLLPELKARGKVIVVISHDESFFSAADRLIKMRDGQVMFDGSPGELEGAGIDLAEAFREATGSS